MERVTWLLIGAMLATALGAAEGQGFRIAADRAWPPLLVLLALAAAWRIGQRRGWPKLELAALAFLQMTAFTVIGVVLAYVIAARAGALWDPWLLRMDEALGARWPALLSVLDHAPALLVPMGLAYHGLSVEMIAVILLLTHRHEGERLQTAIVAAVAAGFVTILLSAAMPAMGNLFDPARFHHLWPSVAWMERDLVTGLRDGTHRTLDLTLLTGIVSFPSFHATLAAIFIWALRGTGPIGRALGGCAGLTILATPVFGGHYAVDVLAGLLLALPALVGAQRLAARRTSPVQNGGASIAPAPENRGKVVA